MVTQKRLRERFSEHLKDTHGFHEFSDGYLAGNSETLDAENFHRLQGDVALLLKHLGLEIQVTDAKPSETILVPVKKAKG